MFKKNILIDYGFNKAMIAFFFSKKGIIVF